MKGVTDGGDAIMPNVRALRRALEPGGASSPDASECLSYLSHTREGLARPLDPAVLSITGAGDGGGLPSTELRQQLSSRSEVSIPVPPDGSPLRLSADAISVAIALSDDLHINEVDAAVLLRDAHGTMMRRPDRDLVAAAKQLYFSRRRETVLYVQEILRARLSDTSAAPENIGADNTDEAQFREELTRERDLMFTEHGLFRNLVRRLSAGLSSMEPPNTSKPQTTTNRADMLYNDEAILLAETIFLAAYTVQLSRDEALSLRDLLESASGLADRVAHDDEAILKSTSRWHQGHSSLLTDADSRAEPGTGKSYAAVAADSVRNVLFLAWLCCLDRSRYSDMYDPRTGEAGVNLLLQDESFVKKTSAYPMQEDRNISPIRSAMEVAGAVFRLAVAQPDLDEASTTFVAACAFGNALEYLSDDLPSWLETGAGSIMPDSQLYADAFEDFAVDLAEAPEVSTRIIQYTQSDLQTFAASDAAAFSAHVEPQHTQLALGHGTATRRPPAGPASKPPRPPAGRALLGGGSSAGTGNGRPSRASAFLEDPKPPVFGSGLAQALGSRKATPKETPTNLVAPMTYMIARAVKLVPSKLSCTSIGGGPRYWSGVGHESTGIVQRIGDALLDMWDASTRNLDEDAVFGDAVVQTLDAFLELLTALSAKGCAPVQATKCLNYAYESGHALVSVDRVMKALTHYVDMFANIRGTAYPEIGANEARALGSLVNMISQCLKALGSAASAYGVIARPVLDLGPKVAALAMHDVDPALRAMLIRSMANLEDRRVINSFLDEMTKNNCGQLRQMIRGAEAETGAYDATIQLLRLATDCCTLGGDDFPHYAIEQIAVYTVDEVMTHWAQRRYAKDADRWRVVRSACDFLLALLQMEYAEGEGNLISNLAFSRLLAPAPGTGEACPALRCLLNAAALRRNADTRLGAVRSESNDAAMSGMELQSSRHVVLSNLDGRRSLEHAALSGDGTALVEMELAIISCCRALRHALLLSPNQMASQNVVSVRPSELLVSEPRALVAAGSLVFAIDDCTTSPSAFRLGYSPMACRAILAMLSTAASQSSLVCRILTRDDRSSSVVGLRCSLADVIVSYGSDVGEGRFEDSIAVDMSPRGLDHSDFTMRNPEEENSVPESLKLPSRMHAVLHLVDACLGMDGSGRPGLHLLGLVIGVRDRLDGSEYGVLSALVELAAGASSWNCTSLDDSSRSVAAVFLERLASNTTPVTSRGVLEFIRSIGTTLLKEDVPVGQDSAQLEEHGRLGDHMLQRIVRFCPDKMMDTRTAPQDINWRSLGELCGACMRLSALQVRQFPEDFYATDGAVRAIEPGSHPSNADPSRTRKSPLGYTLGVPPPEQLLRVLARVSADGHEAVASAAFRQWHRLVAARLAFADPLKSLAPFASLVDICTVLLDALESADHGNDLRSLALYDGGVEASAAVLLCLGFIRDAELSRSGYSGEFIGESQGGVLLGKVVRALASIYEARTDTSRTRTSLYAAFLVCGQLAENSSSFKEVSQAFAGRFGPRHATGAESFVNAAAHDAVSGSSAMRATAIASLAVAARLDPFSIVPAIASQNRLRRVVARAIGEAGPQADVVEGCLEGVTTEGASARGRASVVIAEAAVSLIHAVTSSNGGVNAIAQASCMEAIASMLETLASPQHAQHKQAHILGSTALANGMGVAMNDEGYVIEAAAPNESSRGTDGPIVLVDALTATVAAALLSPDSSLVDGALASLQAGETIFARVVRSLHHSRRVYLTTAGHVATILCRIPAHVMATGSVPANLRSLFAASVGSLSPIPSGDVDVGHTGSPFSVGLHKIAPTTDREFRRSNVLHIDGGSLFERDLVRARIDCLLSVMSCLRGPGEVVGLFTPHLGKGVYMDAVQAAGRSTYPTSPGGSLADIVRIATSAYDEMHRCAEESARLASDLNAQTPASITAQQLQANADYYAEESGILPDQVTSDIAAKCHLSAARCARRQADVCITILEIGLYIVREFTSVALVAVRGHGGRLGSSARAMTLDSAETLMADAREHILPLCQAIDEVHSSVWGERDASFCRQLGRQIRTNITKANASI